MLALIAPIAQEGSGGSSGNFLVPAGVALMVWTLIAFFLPFYLLPRIAFPRIAEALDRRQHAIEESLDAASRTQSEAEALLAEYRERLKEARSQPEEIVARARRAAEEHERE